MAYSINKTDGTLLATVADGQIDELSTDITLIGKNYSGFGEALNENFVKLLENFAGTSRPERPIRGQIWFDSSELKLKVYTGTGFVPVSSASISNVQPSDPGAGDIWFNNVSKQLYFYDGTDFILLGPSYTQSQGLSGFKVETILDNLNASRVITLLYNNGVLLGIFSKDAFTPKLPITGFSGDIIPGFNAGTLAGLKFNVTSTNSDRLNNVLAANYARRDQANAFSEPIIITSNSGITVGAGTEGAFNVQAGNVKLYNTASNKNLSLGVQKGIVNENAINILASTREVKIYDTFVDSTTTVGGSLIVNGDLTVQGNTTTVNTSVVTIEDKNIVLGNVTSGSPTDANADRGGFTLKGTTDHSFYWVNNTAGPVLPAGTEANSAWNSTEHINLIDKAYKIDGVTVLTKTSLGPTITSIPSVTSFGTQLQINAGPVISPATTPTSHLRIESVQNSSMNYVAAITTVDASYPDLRLAPIGTGRILVGYPDEASPTYAKIVGVKTTNEANPVQTVESSNLLSALERTEAVNKRYVTNLVRTRSLAFSLDISDLITDGDIATLLSTLAPVNEYENGTVARILCTRLTNSGITANTSLSAPVTAEFVTPTGTAFAITSQGINSPITVPAQTINVLRTIKTYQIVAGAWQFIS
jgi:hypothetical protein